MWHVASTYLNETRGLAGAQLSSPGYAVAAEGLLVAGRSAQTAPAPAASQSSPPVSSAQVTSPSHTQIPTFTSAMAPFTLSAPVSRPTVFSAGEELKQVTDVQRIDLTTGHASLAGYLQGPLAHAGAFILGGRGPGRRRVQRRLGDRRCHALRPLEHEPDGRWTPTRGPVRLRCRSG